MTLPAPHPRHQRSHGAARVAFARQGGRTRLALLEQQGSAKAFVLPDPGRDSSPDSNRIAGPQVVVLNTSGGLTGGDRLVYAFDVPPQARVTATTQTAERLYRAGSGRARIEVQAQVGAGGHLDWLPQETILFDGACADRTTTIDLAPGAGCLLLETLVLGRAAMGETLARLDLRDTRLVRRAGRPVHLEPLHLTDAALGPRAALLDGARAAASLVLVAPGAADRLGAARAALGQDGVAGGASASGTGDSERLTLRLMAPDLWPLKQQLLRLLAVLRRGPPPRVWQT